MKENSNFCTYKYHKRRRPHI
uniref:Uncharacterized protein n=1 Tax=Anguilla anguilla TaxID=7936 RepID=A0A0E9R2U1_ANGAN